MIAASWGLVPAFGTGTEFHVSHTIPTSSAPLPAGSTTLASYVQNVDRTRATGVELVADAKDVFIRGLELSGWITYVDAKTDKDAALPAAVGKDLPQLSSDPAVPW